MLQSLQEIRQKLPHGMSVQKLLKCKIGIIVPFESIIPQYQLALSKLKFVSNLDIKIGLPYEFAGVEKDIIILSHLRQSTSHQLGEFSKGSAV